MFITNTPIEKYKRTLTISSKVSIKLLMDMDTNTTAIKETNPEPRFISTPQKLNPESTENIVDIIPANKTKNIPVSILFLNIENFPSHMNLRISNATITVETISINNDVPLSNQSQGIGIIANGSKRKSI